MRVLPRVTFSTGPIPPEMDPTRPPIEVGTWKPADVVDGSQSTFIHNLISPLTDPETIEAPRCPTAGHSMVVSSGGYTCNLCAAKFHSGERWACVACGISLSLAPSLARSLFRSPSLPPFLFLSASLPAPCRTPPALQSPRWACDGLSQNAVRFCFPRLLGRRCA